MKCFSSTIDWNRAKIESKHFNSDTSEVIRLTLKHDGSEYVCRIHAYSWRNTCRVVLSKNGDRLLDITADEKCTFTEAVKAAKRLVLLIRRSQHHGEYCRRSRVSPRPSLKKSEKFRKYLLTK